MRDLGPSATGGETRVVARARIVESSCRLSKQPASGVRRREAVGQEQEDEGADEEDEEKKEEKEEGEEEKEAGVLETKEGRLRQGGGSFPGARSRTKGARNVRL